MAAARQGLAALLQGGQAAACTLQHSAAFSTLAGTFWQRAAAAALGPAGALGWQQRVAAALSPSSSAAAAQAALLDVPNPLVDSQLMACPKKKVSPHRRGNRNATKFIRFVPVVAQCSKCGRVFQQHSMPSKCEEDECPAYSLRRRPESAQPQ